MTKADKLIINLSASLTARQKEFLEERFGLKDNQKKTLQELGNRYNITRERVRQIEAEALKSAYLNYSSDSEAVKLVKSAVKHLENSGGAKNEKDFAEDLKSLWRDDSLSLNKARFLFELAKEPFYRSEDENFNGFWHVDAAAFKQAKLFISKAIDFFSDKKEELVFQNKFKDILAKLTKTAGVKESAALNYLAISKKFGVNSYGDFGLAEWGEIHPKTSRAKAYLVLKKHGKPLHFTEIANMINKFGFNKRQAYAQTIHNELIKDNKFVLVGRGMYGLKEHGYVVGTAKDVIKKILEKNGPLHPKQVLETVAEQRFLKDNTILFNLQNKKHFKKLPDGRYHLA